MAKRCTNKAKWATYPMMTLGELFSLQCVTAVCEEHHDEWVRAAEEHKIPDWGIPMLLIMQEIPEDGAGECQVVVEEGDD